VGFVLDEVVLAQVFLGLLQFSSVIIIPPIFHTYSFIHSLVIFAVGSFTTKHALKNRYFVPHTYIYFFMYLFLNISMLKFLFYCVSCM